MTKPDYSIEPLFEPLTLGSATLPSRIVMSPMTRQFSPNGVPSQAVADYYSRRAKANVGLIITEGVGIDHPSAIGQGAMGETNIPLLYGDAALAGWKTVVDDVHAAGGIIFPQLWHMGGMRVAGTGPSPEAPSLRPSGIWADANSSIPLPPEYVNQQLPLTVEMSEVDIESVIAAYAKSATVAKQLGFDGIAVHGAHGYLIDSFFWDITNQRTDHWGGDIVARTRFGAEVIKAIRRAVGPDFPISLRWSQWKQQDYQAKLVNSPQELEQFLQPLVDAGVDMFDTSTRNFDEPAFADSDLCLAGWTRKISGLPTMAVGGVGLSKDLQSSFAGGTIPINNLDKVMQRFKQGEFDLLAVGRSLLVDPEWALKARRNEPFKPFELDCFGSLS